MRIDQYSRDSVAKQIAEYSTVTTPLQHAKVAYLTNDHLGSPRINTDRDGNATSRHDYHPFGEEIITPERTNHPDYTPDSVRQQFTGYERDGETELDFAEARYYNPGHGRFTAVDPLAASALPSDPQTFNRYSYVRNSPTVMIDPTGMMGDYYTRDMNYIGSDGINDGKYYYAEVDYRNIVPEGSGYVEIIHVKNVDQFFLPSTERDINPIQAFLNGFSNGVDDATSGLAKGAGNFAIGTANTLSNPLGPVGARGGVPNPFAIDSIPYGNAKQAAYGTAFQIGAVGGTLVAGAAIAPGVAAPSVVPESAPQMSRGAQMITELVGVPGQANAKLNSAGDLVITGKEFKFRVDFRNPGGDAPHMHLEQFRGGRWRDATDTHRIYPK